MDGRNARKERTKAAVVEAARAAMRAGIFRPTVVDVAKAAGCSVRSVFQHFGTTEGVLQAALNATTFNHVLAQITPNASMWVERDRRYVVMAAVYGRILPE
jgi:AcrR family transcriptional regulator